MNKRSRHQNYKKGDEEGMAMLSALLVLALASGLAVSMWFSTSLDLARMKNTQQAYQAKHLTQGLLLWASDVLKKDYEESNLPWDNNNDSWQQGIQNMPADGAMMSGKLTGLNNCFNINNIWNKGAVSFIHYEYFKRLLLLLSLDVALAEEALDWIDPDQIPRSQGAENFTYLSSSPSYQTGSKAFWHESQLTLLRSFSPEVLETIKPYVCVLPVRGETTKMNVNTIEPVLIRALHPNISEALSLSLYQDGIAAFSQLNDFYNHSEMGILSKSPGFKDQLNSLVSVQTRYIQAEAEIVMENSIHDNFALLKRSVNGLTVTLQRAQSPFRMIKEVE